MKKNKFNNFLAYKNEKNKFNNMTKYAKKAYFRKVTAKKGSKLFWNAIKPFFINRRINNDSITLEENGVLKTNLRETTEVFNN